MQKIYINGIIRDMTPKEEAAYNADMERMAAEFPAPEPTMEEKIAKLEEELKAAKILLGLEV